MALSSSLTESDCFGWLSDRIRPKIGLRGGAVSKGLSAYSIGMALKRASEEALRNVRIFFSSCEPTAISWGPNDVYPLPELPRHQLPKLSFFGGDCPSTTGVIVLNLKDMGGSWASWGCVNVKLPRRRNAIAAAACVGFYFHNQTANEAWGDVGITALAKCVCIPVS